MRIGTWNVEYAYPKRLAALEAVLRKQRADIWILTETHDDLAPPGCEHVVHSAPRPKNWSGIRPGSRWVSIWSAFPVTEHINLENGDAERTVTALLDIGGGESMAVYGTVMPWKGDRGKFDWSEHHRVIPQQCAEWRVLRDRYPSAAICVAGDYNTDMGTGRYYGTREGISAIEAGLCDCGLYCVSAPSAMPTGLLEYPPIDHIALPASWRERTRVVAAWPASMQRGQCASTSPI